MKMHWRTLLKAVTQNFIDIKSLSEHVHHASCDINLTKLTKAKTDEIFSVFLLILVFQVQEFMFLQVSSGREGTLIPIFSAYSFQQATCKSLIYDLYNQI